jgi:hypothetical protein
VSLGTSWGVTVKRRANVAGYNRRLIRRLTSHRIVLAK